MNDTFTVIIDGFRWAMGLPRQRAESEKYMLKDQFPSASILLIKEL